MLALANPGGHGLRTTFGLVSATGRSFRGPRGRRIPGSIEHTAPLPRGSSGGPLVDPEGRLLGLNAVRREGGLILAVPGRRRAPRAAPRRSPAARAASARASASRSPTRAPPASCAPPSGCPDRDGLLVHAVLDGSAAATAGLARGDLLIAAGGTPLTSADDSSTRSTPPRDTLTLRVAARHRGDATSAIRTSVREVLG